MYFADVHKSIHRSVVNIADCRNLGFAIVEIDNQYQNSESAPYSHCLHLSSSKFVFHVFGCRKTHNMTVHLLMAVVWFV